MSLSNLLKGVRSLKISVITVIWASSSERVNRHFRRLLEHITALSFSNGYEAEGRIPIAETKCSDMLQMPEKVSVNWFIIHF